MKEGPRYTAGEFEREAHYIDNLIWDALVVDSGLRLLFCGFGGDARWIKRALESGADVTVIEHRVEIIRKFEDLGVQVLQGSTSLIPVQSDTFDFAISFHYLHEQDPFFHAQIVSELARVARRVAIVEPGPPADALGKRIARLYSQAKRELGQFEYYQPLEYWRKLLQAVKADISQHVFAFAKIPPREYLRDTIALLLDTMEAEDAPKAELEELRALARGSDTLLLPPARFVLMGTALGDLPQPIFTPREEPTPTPAIARAARSPIPVPEPPPVPVTVTPLGFAQPSFVQPPMPQPPPIAPQPPAPNAAPQPQPGPAPSSQPVPPPAAPFGAPFAMPGADVQAQPPPFGVPPMPPGMPPMPSWQWEPPEPEEPPES